MKYVPTTYTFDASAKTIVCADFIDQERIAIITNVTDGEIIYSFADPARGGTLAGTTLTLAHDTTGMDDADILQIVLFPDIFNAVGRLKTSTEPSLQDGIVDTITSNGDTVVLDVSRTSNVALHCYGTFSTINVTFEASLNSTNGTDGNWFTIQMVRTNANTIETTTGNLSAAPAYGWEGSVNGYKWIRVRATAYTSGTQTWVINPAPYATEPIPAAQISGTQPVSGTITASNTAGNVAADGAASGNPVRTGNRASNARPTAVSADNDVVEEWSDRHGARIIENAAPRGLKDMQKTTITSSTSETTIVTAVASIFMDLYGLIITNTSATACVVAIKDATAGTTRMNIAIPAGETRGFMLPSSDAHKQAVVNNNWTATCSASVASIEITALTVRRV